AGGRARQSGPLDHDRLHAAAAEEIGDRSADHAAAADHHPHEDWPPNRYREHDETSNSLRLPPPLVGRACPGLDPRSPRARPREAGERYMLARVKQIPPPPPSPTRGSKPPAACSERRLRVSLRCAAQPSRTRNIMPEIGLFDAIYSARSLRRLKSDPVPEEILTKILDAAIR